MTDSGGLSSELYRLEQGRVVVMKKYITERKWDKLFDEATKGFSEKTMKDGSERYTFEGFNEYMNAVANFPDDYTIIGVRHQLSVLKDRLHDYKLRHLKIGTVKNLNKDKFTDFKIEKIDWDVHWMTNLYLAVIIRDYLRFFIENTPAIGNCVYDHYPSIEEDTLELHDKKSEEWKALVNSVADEFDELAKNVCNLDYDFDLSKHKEMTKKAFADLAFIFDDLEW